ncbi:unnamed protein product [Medioppia subpectinata]|uniref:DJ-1/PfpI domain-containing protein n=1 Tax=Medioppia subpectinata TaxID=1979941 RepID=A0A7R9KGH6_9ACAR|nr:unnamed protein product [Medioppia subpectinata]CAG2101770.1 unnamed protein product [Medioppia subpectinata]
MSPKALVLLATGAEEMEVVITVDVLRRGGISVIMGGLSGKDAVKCSRDVVIVPDISLSEVKQEFDVIVLPGGLEGANALAASPLVGQLLRQQEDSKRVIAAICAAPIALKSHRIGLKKKITSHPSKAQELKSDYDYSEDRVVIDGQLITSRGPGTAFEFALAIVDKLMGSDKVKEISVPMILKE